MYASFLTPEREARQQTTWSIGPRVERADDTEEGDVTSHSSIVEPDR